MAVGNLISGSSAFPKSCFNLWKFSIHILLKPCLENFELYFASLWDECNFVVVWTFFGFAFLWDWNESWPFQFCSHCWVFQICWHIESSTLTAYSFRICSSLFSLSSFTDNSLTQFFDCTLNFDLWTSPSQQSWLHINCTVTVLYGTVFYRNLDSLHREHTFSKC